MDQIKEGNMVSFTQEYKTEDGRKESITTRIYVAPYDFCENMLRLAEER